MLNLGSPLNVVGGGTGITTVAAEKARLGLGAYPLIDNCYRFSFKTATTVQMLPLDGNGIVINGVQQVIPAGGLTLAPTTVPSTFYYFYAAMSGAAGAMALEMSTTGHTTDALGRENKTGDTARRLVGAGYTNASGQFQAFTTLSWANRRDIAFTYAAGGSTGSTTYANLTASQFFVNWADEAVLLTATGNAINNGSAGNFTALAVAGTIMDETACFANVASAYTPVGLSYPGSFSEGQHSFSLQGRVGASAATWTVLASMSTRG